MTMAREPAERISALGYQDLPSQAIKRPRIALLDTIGVMLAGAGQAAPAMVGEARELRAARPERGSGRIPVPHHAIVQAIALVKRIHQTDRAGRPPKRPSKRLQSVVSMIC